MQRIGQPQPLAPGLLEVGLSQGPGTVVEKNTQLDRSDALAAGNRHHPEGAVGVQPTRLRIRHRSLPAAQVPAYLIHQRPLPIDRVHGLQEHQPQRVRELPLGRGLGIGQPGPQERERAAQHGGQHDRHPGDLLHHQPNTLLVPPPRRLRLDTPLVQLDVAGGDGEDDVPGIPQVRPLLRIVGQPVVRLARVPPLAIGEDCDPWDARVRALEDEVGLGAGDDELGGEVPGSP